VQPASLTSEQATRDTHQAGSVTKPATPATREGTATRESIICGPKSIDFHTKSIVIEVRQVVSTPKSIGFGAKQSAFAIGWTVSVSESIDFASESANFTSKSTDFASESTDFVTGSWPRAPPPGTHHPRLFTPAMWRVPCKRNDKEGRILLCNFRNASPT
jgi:hypothetical protein